MLPGYELRVMDVTLAAGAREGLHSHPGVFIGHIKEGEITFDQEGLPTRVYSTGDIEMIDAGRVHEGINMTDSPVRAVVTFIVEKDQPLSTPAP